MAQICTFKDNLADRGYINKKKAIIKYFCFGNQQCSLDNWERNQLHE
jgi:hypothetical protein